MQPNFMTCLGEAGWWPAEINSPCPVASFNWSESKRPPSPTEKGCQSTLLDQNRSLGKQIFAFLWENRWTIPSWRMWFTSLVENFTENCLKCFMNEYTFKLQQQIWQGCCSLKGGGMRLILIMADGGSTSYCNRPLKHDWKQISLKCASEYEVFSSF